MTDHEQGRAPHELWITGDPEADHLLSTSGNALLIGMVLDQQVPMEKAFSGPHVIATRMGGTFDVSAIAALEVDDFVALCAEKPAVHRFPGSMGNRVQALCRALLEDYDGDAAAVWTGAADGADALKRLTKLPGFGDAKSRIFLALLAKQCGVRLEGWQSAAAPYGEDGYQSVADITDAASLAKVREHKQAMKKAAKGA